MYVCVRVCECAVCLELIYHEPLGTFASELSSTRLRAIVRHAVRHAARGIYSHVRICMRGNPIDIVCAPSPTVAGGMVKVARQMKAVMNVH